jgi:excisionase family DNA binding protein
MLAYDYIDIGPSVDTRKDERGMSAGDKKGKDTEEKLTLESLKGSGRATISVEEAGRLLEIGRGKAYECVRNGEIPCLTLGRLKLVPVPALLRLLEECK